MGQNLRQCEACTGQFQVTNDAGTQCVCDIGTYFGDPTGGNNKKCYTCPEGAICNTKVSQYAEVVAGSAEQHGVGVL